MSGLNEAPIRLAFFLGALLAMAVWELLAPRRQLTVSKGPRWASNLGLVALNIVAQRLLLPVSVFGAAMFGAFHNWGLFNLFQWPPWLEIVIAVIVLDLAIYLQHVLFHAVPTLWRLHMVHHADLDTDVTTGIRFHTIEILLSALIKIGVVVAFGIAPLAVVAFEVLLNATSMFSHSNIRMPIWLDRLLRLIVVTPDMHRVHHSVEMREINSNYGFNLPWWDFLLGTYRSQPAKGHLEMEIGVASIRNERDADRLDGMLLLPFRRHRSRPDSPDDSKAVS